jgi:hypothetical protein
MDWFPEERPDIKRIDIGGERASNSWCDRAKAF